jgi:hypothetical protein
MKVIGITPAIKIERENNNTYAALGDAIKIRDCDGRVISGFFLYMKLGKGAEDDTITISIDGEKIEIQCSDITDIEKINY